jgi:CDGSH-type Zn-finger protein
LREATAGQTRAVPIEITAYLNGPYLLRGARRVFGRDGEEIELRRRTVALCRCGRSAIHPFCDGTHKAIGFSGAERREIDPSEAPPQLARTIGAAGDEAARVVDAAAVELPGEGDPD